MAHAPQEIRTSFVASVTNRRHAFFQNADAAELLIDTLYSYRAQGRFELHEFPPHEANCHTVQGACEKVGWREGLSAAPR